MQTIFLFHRNIENACHKENVLKLLIIRIVPILYDGIIYIGIGTFAFLWIQDGGVNHVGKLRMQEQLSNEILCSNKKNERKKGLGKESEERIS